MLSSKTMSIYQGQAAGAVSNVPFVRARRLMAIGPEGDYNLGPHTIAGRNDLMPMLIIHREIHKADAGRLVVDEKHLVISIFSDDSELTIPANRTARSITGDLVKELNPGYRVHVSYEGIGLSPERR
jgi:hypothetical protein